MEPRSPGNRAVPTLTLETVQGPDRAMLQTKITTIQQGGPAFSAQGEMQPPSRGVPSGAEPQGWDSTEGHVRARPPHWESNQ